MAARHAKKAELRLPLSGDDMHWDADRLTGLAHERVAVGRLPDRLRRARDEDLEAVSPRPLDHGPQRPDRNLRPRPDGACARYVGPELRLLHVVGDIHELPAHDVGDQGM